MVSSYFTYTSILSSHHLPSRLTYSYLNLTGKGLVEYVPLAERMSSFDSERVDGPSVNSGSIETALFRIGRTFLFCFIKSPKPFLRSSTEYWDLNSVDAVLYRSEKSSVLMASANSAVVALMVALARSSSTSPLLVSLSLSPSLPNTGPFDVDELLFDDEILPRLKLFPQVQPRATSKTTVRAIAPLRRLSRPNNIELMRNFIKFLLIKNVRSLSPRFQQTLPAVDGPLVFRRASCGPFLWQKSFFYDHRIFIRIRPIEHAKGIVKPLFLQQMFVSH